MLLLHLKNLIKKVGYDISKINKDLLTPDSIYFKLFEKNPIDKRRFYNIGAGDFYHPAWTNVDFHSEWYKDNEEKTKKGIQYNLLSLSPLPIESDIAEIVYTSHTIEHITNEAAQNMFNEAYRILKKNGVFRLTMPNIDLCYQAYKNNDRYFFYKANYYSNEDEIKKSYLKIPMNQASVEQLFLYELATSTSTIFEKNAGAEERISDDKLNEIFKNNKYEEALDICVSYCSMEIQKKMPGYHINWWNKDKLERMLKQAGFKNIFLSGYGQSVCPILRNTYYFDNTHPKLSLYMETIK